MADLSPSPPPASALLREGDYVRFWISRFLGSLGSQVQSVTMGWQVYALSRRTLDVGGSAFNVSLIGLITFAPLFFLALPAGEAVDRHDRRKLLLLCYAGEISTVAVLTWAAFTGMASVPLLLGSALVFGASRSLFSPAMTALGPMMVPRPLLPRAIAWNSLAWQTASIGGPALGGLLVAISPGAAFATTLVLYLAASAMLITIRRPTRPEAQAGSRMELVREGLAYVRDNKIVLGAISLDLAAVILAGAYALMPAFARDILHAGASGFGALRAGPAIGATVIGLILGFAPIHRRAGLIMFSGVAVFALGTIAFGLSRNLWLSVAILSIVGGADMLSVYIRQTLVQLTTPDAMRGRVAAVSTLFISASNELGEFESGLAAKLMGAVGAAVFGGVGALGVVALWARLFPALRRADRLE